MLDRQEVYDVSGANGFIDSLACLREEPVLQRVIDQLTRNHPVIIAITAADYNQKRLYTKQDLVDDKKLANAVRGENKEYYPCGYLRVRTNSHGKQVREIVIGDGNHRTAYYLITDGIYKFPIKVVALFEEGPRIWGFNKMVDAMRSRLPNVR